MKIASALAAAHAAGIVHRDLKPDNVIITPDGEVKVVDFGIAHIERPEPARLTNDDVARLTKDGVVLGTPGYMPPEQLLGGAVDARADVYAFGVVFGEMLLGRRPDTAQDRALIPARFATLIVTCMSPNPEARLESGSALLKALSAESPAPAKSTAAAVGSPRWWWEFHQAATAVVYWVMIWPAWMGRQIIGGQVGRALFIAVLVAIIVAANLRLHLWFTSRFNSAELRWTRRRESRWIRLADWLFVASLGLTGILAGEDRSPVAVVLMAVAAGAAIVFLVIERATTRAAFRASATPAQRSP